MHQSFLYEYSTNMNSGLFNYNKHYITKTDFDIIYEHCMLCKKWQLTSLE